VLTSIKARTLYSKEVTFGGYLLPLFLVKSIGGSIPVNASLTTDELAHWEEVVAPKKTEPDVKSTQMVRTPEPDDKSTQMARTPEPDDKSTQMVRTPEPDDKSTQMVRTPEPEAAKMVHVNSHIVYFGKSTSTPAIGDVRVTLTKILPADISVIAQVAGATFEPYTAANGRVVSDVAMGTVSAETMFADAHSSNKKWTWIIRLIGFVLVIASLKLMFSIIPGLFKIVPFLGKIVGAGVKMVCTVMGCVWSLAVIAVSWLWYRPVVGCTMLAIAFAGIWLLRILNKEDKDFNKQKSNFK
jgi:hypothetical protein